MARDENAREKRNQKERNANLNGSERNVLHGTGIRLANANKVSQCEQRGDHEFADCTLLTPIRCPNASAMPN